MRFDWSEGKEQLKNRFKNREIFVSRNKGDLPVCKGSVLLYM